MKGCIHVFKWGRPDMDDNVSDRCYHEADVASPCLARLVC